jgi:Domain of unknown function (DUF3127)
MKEQGVIIAILEIVTFSTTNGIGQKQSFVIETKDQYPRKVCFELNPTKIDLNRFEKGQTVDVFFNLKSNEWNGKWFTKAEAWKVELLN